jgi:hypothetical protein
MTSKVGEVYFEVNSDVEIQSSNTSEADVSLRCITWRGDPEDTGSDCSITIVTNELQTNTYYVHKSIICFGSKRSKYFASQFIRNPGTNANDSNPKKNQAIKVELDQRDADNFPLFLDFVYKTTEDQDFYPVKNQNQTTSANKMEVPIVSNCTMETAQSSFSSPSMMSIIPSSSADTDEDGSSMNDAVYLTTENAVSLRYLARRFENEALTLVVNKYIQKNLNFNTGPIYLYNAWEYKDERLVESAQRLCVENIAQIDMKALIKLPVHLFRVVIKSLESFEDENQELSLMLSDVVCQYLEQNPKCSSAELLLDLTDPLLMPYISPDAAIGYTAIVKDLESEDVGLHWDSLVRLCRRCARAVVKEYGWSDFSVSTAVNEYLVSRSNKAKVVDDSDETKSRTSAARVDSLLFATSFAAALEQAQEDYGDVLNAHDQFRTLIKLLEDSASALQKSHQRKDDYITKQQNELRRVRQEVVDLKRQIVNLKQSIRQTCILPQNQKQPLGPQSIDRIINVHASQSSLNSEQARQGKNIATLTTSDIPRNVNDSSKIKGSKTPPIQPDEQSSPSKTSRVQRRPKVVKNVSSPAPMARHRMCNNQVGTNQTNHGLQGDSSLKLPLQYPPQDEMVDSSSRMCERNNQVLNHTVYQQHPQHSRQNPTHDPRSLNESVVHQRNVARSGQSPPFSQQIRQLQHHQPKRTKRHVLLNKANNDQYKYHPDLLELSYSEPLTTMDDEEEEGCNDDNNDGDYDSLFEIGMSFSSLGQDLVSPSQVGVEVHSNKNEKRRELKTRNEMRSKSLLV